MRAATFALVAFAVAVGCSSKDDPAPAPAPAADGGASSSSGTANGVGNGGACIGEASFATCLQCCNDKNREAGLKFAALVRTCMCKAENCVDACKDSLCATPSTDYAERSPCEACLEEKDPACSETTSTACDGDPVCRPLLDCFVASECDLKP